VKSKVQVITPSVSVWSLWRRYSGRY